MTAEAARVQREEAAFKAQSEKYSYKVVSAGGKNFVIPFVNCPAATCQATSTIALYSSNPSDQKAIKDYQAALDAEKTKTGLTIAATVPAVAYAPAAFGISSAVNAGSQLLQTGEVDARGAAISGVAGSAGAAITAIPVVGQTGPSHISCPRLNLI